MKAFNSAARHDMRDACRPDPLAGELFPDPPRQERSRRAHDALVAAALSRFAESGYELTSIDDIATQAGVAVGAFYLHFRSKRQMLLVLLARLLEELDFRPVLTPNANAAAIIERLRDYFRKELTYAGVYRAWREAALRDTALAALDAQLEAWTIGRATDLLDAAAARPGARANTETPVLARMLSAVFWWSIDTPSAERDAVSNTVATGIRHVMFEDTADLDA